MSRRVLFWFKAARPEFFTGALMPVVVGGAVAWSEGHNLHWGLWLLTALGMMLLQAAANLANDYYDYASGNDPLNVTFVSPFTGGSRIITDGLVPPRPVLVASLVCLAAGAAVGLYLTYLRGWVILAFGLVGGLTGFFYTARPLQLGYRGLGEICIALDFGILPVLGTYYVQTGGFSRPALWAALPVTCLITAVLWINQFQDYAADRAVAKRHWVVRLGLRRASLVYALLLGGAYLSLALAVVAGILPAWTLLALLTLPLAVKAVAVAFANYDKPSSLTPANALTVLLQTSVSLLLALGLVLARVL